METRPASGAHALSEAKRRASLLPKDLRSSDRSRAYAAAMRFCALSSSLGAAAQEVLARRDRARRKHALAVVAHELGFGSWLELSRGARQAADVDVARLFDSGSMAFLNRWFSSYAEAEHWLRRDGGYLFPYRRQFVVCERDLLASWGIDPDEPDWPHIGYNWAAPTDLPAFHRLSAKLAAAIHAQPSRPAPHARRRPTEGGA